MKAAAAGAWGDAELSLPPSGVWVGSPPNISLPPALSRPSLPPISLKKGERHRTHTGTGSRPRFKAVVNRLHTYLICGGSRPVCVPPGMEGASLQTAEVGAGTVRGVILGRVRSVIQPSRLRLWVMAISCRRIEALSSVSLARCRSLAFTDRQSWLAASVCCCSVLMSAASSVA